MTAFLSPSDKAAPGRPFASFGAIAFSATATIRVAKLEKPFALQEHRQRHRQNERVTLRHQHRFAAAGRAAHVVRMFRRPAVVNFEDLPRDEGQPSDCQKLEIDYCLLILQKLPSNAPPGSDGRYRSWPPQTRAQSPAGSQPLATRSARRPSHSTRRRPVAGIGLSTFPEGRWQNGCRTSCHPVRFGGRRCH